jgi:hypothetical protein
MLPLKQGILVSGNQMHWIVSQNRACGTQNGHMAFTTGVGHSQRACAIKNKEYRL